MHAARNGHLEVVDILLSHNADINATNDEGRNSKNMNAYQEFISNKFYYFTYLS